MNTWSFTGHVGRDSETRFTASGTAIATFSVAVKKGFGEHEKTVWPVVEIWGKRAESLSQYIVKGTKIGVTGEVYEDTWTDKEGNERKTLKVNARDIDLLSPKGESSGAPPEPPGGGNQHSMGDDCPF